MKDSICIGLRVYDGSPVVGTLTMYDSEAAILKNISGSETWEVDTYTVTVANDSEKDRYYE